MRIPVSVEVGFFCCNKVSSGTITDISEKGMFIKTGEMCFPFDSQFEIFIPMKEKIINVFAILKRIIMSPDSYDGIGVELLNPSQDYLEFVDNLRPVL